MRPSRSIRILPLLAFVIALALPLLSGSASAAAKRWQPQPTSAAWQWQLQGKIDTSYDVDVYEVDGFETAAKTVAKLHNQGRKVICYLDIGAWEEYRSDQAKFPKSVLGNVYDGYPEERWLDIRQINALAPILRARFDLCARKGLDAVEPDNLAGYENATGFPLSGKDQLRFNRWVAREVHKRGMSVALKNDPEQVKQLVGDFDFAVVEECFSYDECERFSPFVEAGKAVFVAQYEEPLSSFCPQSLELRFATIKKGYDLFAKPWQPCVKP